MSDDVQQTSNINGLEPGVMQIPAENQKDVVVQTVVLEGVGTLLGTLLDEEEIPATPEVVPPTDDDSKSSVENILHYDGKSLMDIRGSMTYANQNEVISQAKLREKMADIAQTQGDLSKKASSETKS